MIPIRNKRSMKIVDGEPYRGMLIRPDIRSNMVLVPDKDNLRSWIVANDEFFHDSEVIGMIYNDYPYDIYELEIYSKKFRKWVSAYRWDAGLSILGAKRKLKNGSARLSLYKSYKDNLLTAYKSVKLNKKDKQLMKYGNISNRRGNWNLHGK